MRHSFVVDKSYDLEKVLKLFYKQMQVTPLDESVGRTVPVLIIDNASAIPDEFPIHQYRIGNVTKAYDIKAIQNGLGSLNFCVIKATPHRACAEDAQTDFLSDCIEIPQAYLRMSRNYCAR